MESKFDDRKQENVNDIMQDAFHSDTKAEDNEPVDEALDILLDNAMNQFESLKMKNENEEREQQQQQQQQEKQFSEIKSDEVKDFLDEFVDQDPKLKEQWTKLTESCQKAATAKTEEEFDESISETLKNLAENAKNLAENSEISDEELSRIWSNINIPETNEQFKAHAAAAGEEMLPEMMPLITNMMQSLLSKDILYPALKDLISKYPEWLDENKEKLTGDEIKKYTKQLDLMKIVCNEFDSEREGESDHVKSDRFQRILQIMQQMQQCGSPPKDLVGDSEFTGIDGDFDFSKLPGFPSTSNPNTCSMM